MFSYTFLLKPTIDQIKQITQLYRNEGWWTDPEDNPELIERMIEGSHCFMIATDGDKIIGMGRAISDRATDAYIQDVAVANTYRGNGVGTRIINELVARLREDSLDWIGLIAERGSHGFYSRLGFKQMKNSVPMLMVSP
jgi:spermidine synthase